MRALMTPALPAPAPPDTGLEVALPAPSLRRIAVVSILVLVLGVGGLLSWAATTPLERAVIANGTLVAEGRRKSIQLLEPGILRELLVREGETVAPGQALLRLDVTQAQATANQARVQRWAALARAARLRAEQSDERSLQMPEELTSAAATDPIVRSIIANEQALFAARWAAFDGAIAVQERRVGQLQEQVAAAQALRSATETRLRATREELSGVQRLLASGFATRTRLLELQRAEAEHLGNLGLYAAQEAQHREAIAATELEAATLRLDRRSEIARELQEAEAIAADAAERLRSAEDILRRREVTAPEAGTVTDIRYVTSGSSIAAGEPVLDLVPLDDRLVVEAQIPPHEIEQLHTGQPVNVRLSAYRQRETPLIEGRLIYVSADRQVDSRGNAYFVARAELDPTSLQAASGVQLAAGMPAEVFVLGERRTALDYLVRPIRDSMRRSFRD